MVMIELNKTINSMSVGEVLEFMCNDRVSLQDIPAWSERTGNELLQIQENDGTHHFLIRKGERVRNIKRTRNFSRF